MSKNAPRILEDVSVTTLADLTTTTDREEQLALFEIDDQIEKKGSVVKRRFKLEYKLNAQKLGARGKAAKRSRWDWVAQRMAEQTLTKKAKTDVDKLYAFLDANDVDHSNWTNRSPGWEGRLRMTGGLALRRIVAERGTLFTLTDGEWDEIEVPADELEVLRVKHNIEG